MNLCTEEKKLEEFRTTLGICEAQLRGLSSGNVPAHLQAAITTNLNKQIDIYRTNVARQQAVVNSLRK